MTSETRNAILNNEHNYGIDLLRITAMLMIVIWHIIVHGSAGSNPHPLSSNYYLINSIKIFLISAVNIYALISGYVGLNSKFRCYKIILLWMEVLFYNVLITAAGFFLSPETVTLKMLILSFIPMKSSGLWYFSAYFVMFFFTPFFNRLINTADRKTVRNLIIIMISLFCLSSVLTKYISQSIPLIDGYSTLWLSALYIIGGYIKKYWSERKDERYNIKYPIGFFVCVIVHIIYFFTVSHLTYRLFGEIFLTDRFMSYISPIVFFQSVFAFLTFSQIKIKNTSAVKIITTLSAATFGVYAIHDNAVIRKNLMTGIINLSQTSSIQLFFKIIILALGIYIICSFIDIIRRGLFKILRINDLSKKIGGIFEKIFDWTVKITDKFNI